MNSQGDWWAVMELNHQLKNIYVNVVSISVIYHI